MNRILVLVLALAGILSFFFPFHHYSYEASSFGHTESYSYSLSGYNEIKILIYGPSVIDESLEGFNLEKILEGYKGASEYNPDSWVFLASFILGHLSMPIVFPLLAIVFLVLGLARPQRNYLFLMAVALVLGSICVLVDYAYNFHTEASFMGVGVEMKISVFPQIAFFSGLLVLALPFFISMKKTKNPKIKNVENN